MTADALFQMIRQLPVPQMQPVQIPVADPEAVKSIVEMGFSETRAEKALILNGNSVEAAMEWLFQHCEDADIDVPLTQAQLQQLGGGRAGLFSMLGMGAQPQQPPPAAAASPQPAAPVAIAPLTPDIEVMPIMILTPRK